MRSCGARAQIARRRCALRGTARRAPSSRQQTHRRHGTCGRRRRRVAAWLATTITTTWNDWAGYGLINRDGCATLALSRRRSRAAWFTTLEGTAKWTGTLRWQSTRAANIEIGQLLIEVHWPLHRAEFSRVPGRKRTTALHTHFFGALESLGFAIAHVEFNIACGFTCVEFLWVNRRLFSPRRDSR